jgi:type II secretory pathway predicted ATPase ExeA
MYEKHFGLKTRPFRSSHEGSGIFVGAQVKVASLKSSRHRTLWSVCWRCRCRKTTVVNRALEAITSKRAVARVGRMQLAADEVLELLLTEYNVSRQPNGTIQRFAAFKRLLHDWAIGGTRAFIIVEDAERIGNDALIELEALTASDSGDSAGASIVLMGQPSLAERLSLPDLARLKQRTRLRQTIVPFTAAEVQGYVKHCIRAAGGDFDAIFDPGAIDMLYRCSEGVPRVINNLCESVLAAAAEAGASLVMPQLVQHVASEEFGLQPTLPPGSRSKAARKPAAEVVAPQARPTTPPKAKVDVKPPVAAPVKTVVDVKPANAANITTEFEPIPVVPFTPDPEVGRPVAFEPAAAPTVAVDPPKKIIAVAAATIADAAKPAIPAAPATVADAPRPAVTVAPVVVADPPQPAIVTVAATQPDELPLEQIPELIQDTQPELVALRANTELPNLTDLVLPSRSNGSARVTPKAKVPSELTLPTLDDIPTLSGDLRIDTRAKEVPAKSVQSRPPQQPNAMSSKAEPSKPARSEPALPKSTQAKVADAAPPPKVQEESKADTTITEIPAWDRDPTLAELKPDIEALEAALAFVPEPVAKPEAKSDPKPATATASPKAKPKASPQNFDLPEIILEKELQVKEIQAQELLKKAGPPDTHEVEHDIAIKRKHGFDLDRLAAELGKARSLEDVDDKLAETLFGEEMAQAAAEVAALVASDASAKNLPVKEQAKPSGPAESAPVASKPAVNARPAVSPTAPPAAARTAPGKANGLATGSTREPARQPGVGIPTPANAKPAAPKAGTAAPSVPAAKSAGAVKPTPPVKGPSMEITLGIHPDPAPAAPARTPEPIEEQFGTSMTATLKALSAAQINKMEEHEPDEPEEKDKPSRRLFGLFRGSN